MEAFILEFRLLSFVEFSYDMNDMLIKSIFCLFDSL